MDFYLPGGERGDHSSSQSRGRRPPPSNIYLFFFSSFFPLLAKTHVSHLSPPPLLPFYLLRMEDVSEAIAGGGGGGGGAPICEPVKWGRGEEGATFHIVLPPPYTAAAPVRERRKEGGVRPQRSVLPSPLPSSFWESTSPPPSICFPSPSFCLPPPPPLPVSPPGTAFDDTFQADSMD